MNNYYKTKESVEEYIEMAKDVNSNQLIEKVNKHLPENSTVLELGSGPGTDFKILTKTHKVVGSDFSSEFLERLHNNYPNDKFLQLDAITLETNKKFNGIYSNKVLQHLSDEDLKNSIQRQVNILNPNGMICHSFWKGDGDEIFKGMLVNYQTKSSLQSLFEKDFEIVLIEEYKEFDNNDSIVIICKKK